MSGTRPRDGCLIQAVVPGYHILTFAALTVNLGWRIYRAAADFSGRTTVDLLLACGLILLYFYARAFALRVQDRVIRLEMRLRLARLLPPDVLVESDRLDVGQLIALRFASDAERPALARRVLADHITDRKAIKQMVKDWQADELRV